MKTLEKCQLLKMWHVIKVNKKNFSPKMLLLHFCRDISSLENQKTFFWSKLFYNIENKNLIILQHSGLKRNSLEYVVDLKTDVDDDI
jgi:hypothetical protein